MNLLNTYVICVSNKIKDQLKIYLSLSVTILRSDVKVSGHVSEVENTTRVILKLKLYFSSVKTIFKN